jgi:hypothetical protein
MKTGKPSGKKSKYISHPTKADWKNVARSYLRPNISHCGDGARAVANRSKKGTRLNTHQVRILRFLAKADEKIGQLALAEKTGPGRNYGGGWENGLLDLQKRKLVKMTPGPGDKTAHENYFHKITPLGKKVIAVCEAIAAIAAKG